MPYPGSDPDEELYSVPPYPSEYLNRAYKPEEIIGRRVELERIALLSGRPVRTTTIGDDDACNLIIALETSTSLEEFIGRV
jgi:hypothetical protein